MKILDKFYKDHNLKLKTREDGTPIPIELRELCEKDCDKFCINQVGEICEDFTPNSNFQQKKVSKDGKINENEIKAKDIEYDHTPSAIEVLRDRIKTLEARIESLENYKKNNE